MNRPIRRARALRRNQTDHERLLWSKLRSRRFSGFKFRRQVPLGDYIVDFVCFERRLVIELDGGQHDTTHARAYDAERTAWLEGQGFRLVRFWNHELLEERDGVEELIWRRLHDGVGPTPGHPLTPGPSPARGEGRMG